MARPRSLAAHVFPLAFGCALALPLLGAADADADPCPSYRGTGCYWMENTTGHYCWVPATWAKSFESCRALDSCDGGEGQSGGGCYKWARCSHCTRAKW